MVNAETVAKLSSVLKPSTDEQGANAAVALLLKSRGQDFEILLVKRVMRKGDVWSGQMAIPGGKQEPKDQNLKATVIRETFEETGIDINENQFLGVLNAVQSVPRPDFRILPFVVTLETEPEVTLNRSELDAYMWVPYERIIRSHGTSSELGFGEVPAFLLGNAVVWGITYKILRDFAKTVENTAKH
jgi:8-oxo-dGTP pyrophosphatase MutT (NUDIX family)